MLFRSGPHVGQDLAVVANRAALTPLRILDSLLFFNCYVSRELKAVSTMTIRKLRFKDGHSQSCSDAKLEKGGLPAVTALVFCVECGSWCRNLVYLAQVFL